MNLHEKILEHYGIDHQIAKCIEESEELIEELFFGDDHDAIRSEIADLKNILKQMEIHFDKSVDEEEDEKSTEQWQAFKLNRTHERMEKS